VKRLAHAILLLFLLPTLAQAATLFVLRHGEDLDEGRDPVLTEAGRERAEYLAEMLADAGIEYVLSSDYHRTRDTVAFLAERLALPVEIYDPRDLPQLVAELERRDGRGLVVGHSNTTPDLVERLGGEPGEPIDEMEFDRLYIVDTEFDGDALTIRLRYGSRLTSP
jgi:broad specificity phosphatase PhoE